MMARGSARLRVLSVAGMLHLAGSLALAQSGSGIALNVIDQETREPIAAAAVTIRALTATTPLRLVTNQTGRIEHLLTPDSYEVAVTRTGYAAHTDTIEVRAATLAQLTIALKVTPLPIDSVAAEANARRPYLGGFWERRQRSIGYYFTRDDIEKIRPIRVPDLFRKVPGAKILKGPNGFGQWVSFDRYRRLDGTTCPAALYVDGRYYVPSPAGLDDFLPDDIEAIEAYSGAARLPAEFNAAGRQRGVEPRCGVIVIWTRQ